MSRGVCNASHSNVTSVALRNIGGAGDGPGTYDLALFATARCKSMHMQSVADTIQR